MVTFVDDHTLHVWVYIFKHKDEVFQVLQIVARVETHDQTTNQSQCDHGRWPEANVGQQF